MTARLIAAAVAVTLLVGVSAPPSGAAPASTMAPSSSSPAALEPATAAAAASAPQPAAPQPSRAPAAASESSHSRPADVYDVAGGVVTALKAPFNVGLCALGGVLGVALFAVTLGSGYRAAARTVEEGCSGPWVVTGDDLRPERGRPVTRLSDVYPGELEGR